MKLEDLLGRHVRYKGEEGRIVEGHADVQASIVISIVSTILSLVLVPRKVVGF